jgi:hypothetical protein
VSRTEKLMTLRAASAAIQAAIEPYRGRGLGYVVILGVHGLPHQNTEMLSNVDHAKLATLLIEAAEQVESGRGQPVSDGN